MRFTYFDDELGYVEYEDTRQNWHSQKAKAKDIIVKGVSEKDKARLAFDIAVDLRKGQGVPLIGIAKGV